MSTAVTLAPLPVFRAWDNNGNPLFNGQLFTYIAGSSTPQATYVDSTGTTQNTNPVILNARGEANVWLASGLTYKLTLQDSLGNQLWSVDQIPGGINAAVVAIINSTVNQAFIGAALYPRTAAEISAGVTPTAFQYPADPYVDPRRYGADPTGAADSSAALQKAINVAYAASGAVWLGNNCTFLCNSALSLTLSGSGNTKGLRIIGSSAVGSIIKTTAALATPLITITASAPGTAVIAQPIHFETMSIQNAGAKTGGGHGLSIVGVANWVLKGLYVNGFDHNLDLQYSLSGVINDNCIFVNGNYGISISFPGTYPTQTSTTNLIRIENSTLDGNTTWGLEFAGGTQLQMRGLDIEGNGTSLNFATGGVHIKGALSPDLLTSGVLWDYCWFEGNLGTSLLVDVQTGGDNANFSFTGGHIIGAQSQASLTCNGMTRFLLQDVAYMDTVVMQGSDFTCINSLVNTLTDSSTFPTYINVQTSGGFQYAGRKDTNQTFTLTGCTTSPTVTPTFVQQGDVITCYIPDFTATSNTTACTITGIPSKYAPALQHFFPMVVENSGSDTAQQGLIVAAGTTLILYQGGSQTGFTNSGSKGIRSQELRWRL